MRSDNPPSCWPPCAGEAFYVRVTPKASRNALGSIRLEDRELRVQVYVTTAPEDGKANAAVLKLLAKEMGVAKSSLVLVHGHKGRDKLVRLES